MQNNPSSQAMVVKTRAISPIWFLPFIAAILGIWILFQNITHKDVQVTIHFTNADSIIVSKTKIRYKGVIVGTVKKIELDEVDGVNVIAEIESHAVFLLKEKSKFWLVSPKASLTSISGLDTLFSGSYINLLPGEGEQSTDFVAITEQPISIPDNALLLNLTSNNASSINVGSPIFFKKIQVGEIVRVRLDKSGQFVNIKAFIESKYSYLVKSESKFWNISGLNANISRAGIDIKLDSLTSIIAGGITFSSPDDSSAPVEDHQFELYDNIKDSEQGLNITLKLANANNLPNGAGILFKGHGIGRINNIRYDTGAQLFVAQAIINPAFSELITKNSEFWIEKTAVSFSKIENLGNLITGDYVGFSHSDNYQQEPQKTDFFLHSNQSTSDDYLSVTLIADNANGLSEGAPVTYKGLNIGNISSLTLSKDSKHIKAVMDINNEFSYLITKNSKFHLHSGIDFKASLKGLEVNSKPLQNMLQGGIALYNKSPVTKKSSKDPLKKTQKFHLYASKEMASLGKNVFAAPHKVSMLSKNLPSVSIGSPVYYHKLQVGEVSGMKLHNSGLMQTRIEINAQFKHLITDKTVFWNVSGFKVDAGLSGIKVAADSLLSIAAGGIALELAPSKITTNKTSDGQYRLFDSYQQATVPPKQLTLTYDDAFDLKVGNKVKLKGLEIGEISRLTLNNRNKVIVTLDIHAEYYAKVAKYGSRFWIVRSDISLSGAKNLSTLISGVFINVSPGTGNTAIKFKGEGNEPLLAKNKTGLPIKLLADNAGSTDITSPVYHRQIQIGEVIDKQLNDDASGVEIVINIYPEYSHLIRANSVFWPASGFNLDVGITGAALKATSLTSLIKGGINMSTPDDEVLQPASEAFSVFDLQTESKERWLEWKLKIPKS